MSMEWIISHMGKPLYNDEKLLMEKYLTEQINALSRAVVVEQIRTVVGTCKRIVKLRNGNYNFHLYSWYCSIDWEPSDYITAGSEDSLGLLRTGRYLDGVRVYVTHNPSYNGISLVDIIEYGEECEECGVVFITDLGHTICNRCAAANEPLPYSSRAEDILEMEQTQEILFGVELEYEGVTARDVKNTISTHAIAKRDGSIHNGVEVVTRPACLSTHKVALREFYNKVKTQSHENTGMHVHIERAKLSEYQIGFMMEFLNHKELVPHIETIAGRKYSQNSYCRPKDDVRMTEGVYFDEGKGKVVRSHTDKYSPLNTAKQHTVEVRIFSSPESHLECSAKLDFVNALVQYSSPYSVSVKRLKDKFDWGMFLSYIKANQKQFPHFAAFYL